MGQTTTGRYQYRRYRGLVGGLSLVLLASVFLFVGGSLIYFAMSEAGKPVSAPLPEAPFDVGAPTDPGASWAPAPTDLPPNTLAIPDLDVRADIVTSGFGANRGMILPHPDKVSHFTNGVQFGSSEGTNLVAGHVDDGDRTQGALWALHQMKPGTPIYVSDGGGTMFTYYASSLKLYEKVALPEDVFAAAGPPRLVLVTCGGKTVPDPSLLSGFTYEQNVVVTARLQ
jgi:hypothetical protein